MPRFGPILVTILVMVMAFLGLAYANPDFAGWLGSWGQLLPQPLNTMIGAAVFLGLLTGFLFSFLFTPGAARPIYARRPRSHITRSQSLVGPSYRGGLPPMFKYFGGKSRLAKTIVSRIPEHRTRVEPFAGGGSVTLAKPPSPREVMADKRVDLVRFYQTVKKGIRIPARPVSKYEFDRIKHKPEASRTPSEFYLLQSKSFGGHGQSWADGNSAGVPNLLNRRISRYKERLRHTSIMTGDYQSIIKRYDSPKTAMYLDPPYPVDRVGYTDYGRRIPTVQEVKQSVDHAKGKVMISYPDLPNVKKAFTPPHWHTERFRVHRPLSYSTGTAKTRTELLITNYPRRDRWRPEGVMG